MTTSGSGTETALTLVEQTSRDLSLSRSYVELIKDVYAKNATDDELALFLRTAHRLGLDPTARQIYLVKRWDSSLKREVATPQVSIDGFRVIADRTGQYVPGREATFEYAPGTDFRDPRGLISATAYIKKMAGGEWHEISATAFFSEYVQKTKEGKPNAMWSRMPHLMLAKCAESLVLRKAFPAELSGVYTSEEMGQGGYDVPQRATKSDLVAGAAHEYESDDSAGVVRISDLCKQLVEAGDDIKWNAEELRQFAEQLFDVDIADLSEISDAMREALSEELTARLEIVKAERAA